MTIYSNLDTIDLENNKRGTKKNESYSVCRCSEGLH